MTKPRPTALAPALALNVLIASGTFLVAKATLRDLPPLVLALYRFVLATALLLPATRLLRPRKRIAPADRLRVWLLGLVAVPINQGFFLFGLQWASASHAALLYALTPAFVVLFLAWRSGERPSAGQLAGIALAFAGVLTLLLQRGLHFDRHSVMGDGIILIAVAAWAVYLSAGRSLIHRYGPLLVTTEALTLGTLTYLPIGLLFAWGFDWRAVSAPAWGGLVYLAWLTSALNYVIWFWGLEYLSAGTVALLTNLQPVVAALMARAFLGEHLPAGFALSAALVIGGVWITQRSGAGTPVALSPAAPE